MSSRLKNTLVVAGSFALGTGLLYLALRDVEFASVGVALRTAAYGWLVPLFIATIVAHLLRAWRWQMLLETLPDEDGEPSERVSLRLAFYSVMIGYMVNYAAPRLGEVVRAGNVASHTKLRFSGIFGTVVVERVLDALVLLMALVTVAALFRERLVIILGMFFGGLNSALVSLPLYAWILIALVALVITVGAVLINRALKRGRVSEGAGEESRLLSIVRSFRDGLVSLVRVRRRIGVLLTTLGIWFCYFVMADLPLRLFGITRTYNVDLLDSWALLNVGAIGMSIPSPGGTGSFHYATIQTLVHLLGVPENPAATYAIFSHAAQLILVCVVGFACLIVQGTSLKALRVTTAEAHTEEAPESALEA